MRIIKTMRDIELLKKAAIVDNQILYEIEKDFRNIYYNVDVGVILEEFSLVEIGLILLLEPGDNVSDLEEIGLDPEENGLLGAIPEFIDEQKLANCTLMTACILCNNEYALNIFFEKGKFGDKVEKWIVENS